LIYDDEGVSAGLRQVLPKTLGADLDPAAHRIATIDSRGLAERSWRASCAALIMPGGRDLPYHRRLAGAANAQIRRFVEEGGGYLGLCAGGYYGSARVEFDRGGELEVAGSRALAFFPGVAIGPAYGPGTFRYESQAGARAAALALSLGDDGAPMGPCVVYFNGGCFFAEAERFPAVKVLARYRELPGEPAAIVACAVGRGTAILSGVHPEFRLGFARRDAEAPAGLYADLAVGETACRRLFRDLLCRLGLALKPWSRPSEADQPPGAGAGGRR
jgi:biotin--protein ligase